MIDERRLREILEEELGCDLDGIEADTLLFSTGVLDSFSLVTLMTILEGEAGFRVQPSDMVLENFDSINGIIAFVARQSS